MATKKAAKRPAKRAAKKAPKKVAKQTQQKKVAATVKAGSQKFACYLRRGIKVNQFDKKPRNKVFCYEVQ